MEFAFGSRTLRTLCESEAYAKRELGPTVAEVLKHRLADLRAATSIKDIIVGRPRIWNEANQHMVIDLCDGYRIIFSANHPNNPLAETGKIDWLRVSRIKMLRVESDHV